MPFMLAKKLKKRLKPKPLRERNVGKRSKQISSAIKKKKAKRKMRKKVASHLDTVARFVRK
jgi:hypothetical protein